MKKYFVVETDEAIEFGDVVNLTFFKEIEDGKVTIEKEVEFNEDTMDMLIEMGFVEEREVEENDLIDFSDKKPCETLVALEEDFEELEQRVDAMEAMIKEIYDLIKSAVKEEKKNAQPKKK
jgi:aconitase B